MYGRLRIRLIRTIFMSVDMLFWILAILLAGWLRVEFDISSLTLDGLLVLGIFAAVVQSLLGTSMGIYRGRHAYGSFHEVRTIAYLVLLTGALSSVFVLVVGHEWSLPRSTAVMAIPIALTAMLAIRYILRLFYEHRRSPTNASRVIVYGAGYLGEVIIRRMQTDPGFRFRPVALLDDNPEMLTRRIRGVRVRGGLMHMPTVAKYFRATDIVVAIGRADTKLIRRISEVADEANLKVHVLPLLDQVLEGKARISDLRELSIEDLIGRRPVDMEVESIAGYLTGKRVMVTGAGGSIGSELCKQIQKFAPAELMMVDRDETGLQLAQLQYAGHGLLNTKEVILADIRDADAIEHIFQDRKPQVVYHAAALKHLPMLEQYPEEAWKSNVMGTLNVLTAARNAGVETFINISTDKAANPVSVLGHSKRAAEKLAAWIGQETESRYLSVRFGNVIGSRGSMLPTFRKLIEKGGPLTVTHPDVTRYFMTIPEACQLVVQAGAVGTSGEVLILDMGEPVRILDIANRMIEMSGKDIQIKFTGLRVGEKLHEELLGDGEDDFRPFHPKITHTISDTMSPTHLDKNIWLELCGKLKVQKGGDRVV